MWVRSLLISAYQSHPPTWMESKSNVQAVRTGICPANIAATQKVRDVKISPDTRQIIYQVVSFYKGPERMTSEIWIADTDVAESARLLTDGLFNDRAAVFHPSGDSVIFLSDRRQPGKAKDLHQLLLSGLDDGYNPQYLELGRNVQSYELSPDGRYIAFSSTLEVPVQSVSSDAKVFGSQKSSIGIWVYNFETKEITSVDGIDNMRHIESFTWSPDSLQLLYRLRKGRETEYSEMEVVLQKISIIPGSTPVTVGMYPRSPSGSNIWLDSGHILDLQNYEPRNVLDARTLFVHDTIDPFHNDTGLLEGLKRLYGESEDAVRIVNMQTKKFTRHEGSGMVAVEVCADVDTHIDAVYFRRSPINECRVPIAVLPIFRTQGDAIWFGAWDAKHAYDPATGKTTMVTAAVLSSGIRNEPPNVWSVRLDENLETGEPELCNGTRCWPTGNPLLTSVRRKLSSHLQWLKSADPIHVEVIHWLAEDGSKLSGLVRTPGCVPRHSLPTVLFIHGGPYRRDIPDYMPYFCNWRELLASAGYLVISPNYRGSQGKGHAFAHAASEGIGVQDWGDCESMLNEVIRRGLADPSRLAVAGWSHGGSLTAWGVTLTKNRFKAAIIGAGATHWESMVMESGSPELEKAIGQRDPWNCGTQYRKPSPIHRVEGVSTAILILHGEKDERVPVGQAIGLYRGLQRKGSERCKQGSELVVYPREPH
ncbi:hypothetical protein GYMLUDRAFT_215460, partial [Collybiopsis luxurians FD-317 M1]